MKFYGLERSGLKNSRTQAQGVCVVKRPAESTGCVVELVKSMTSGLRIAKRHGKMDPVEQTSGVLK